MRVDELFATLVSRNSALAYFGAWAFASAAVFAALIPLHRIEVAGVNAWFKPLKFAISTGIYAWSMAWFTGYLRAHWAPAYFNWVTMVTLGFEVVYIAIQAGRGELSHFNLSTPLYASLFSLMAAAATIATLAAIYPTILFFAGDFPQLPRYYLWAIRAGLVLFIVFSFEGFVMGSRMAHTIGAPDGGPGLPLVNWSKTHGDARVAHFVGMHALQIIPLVSYFILRNTVAALIFASAYAAMAIYTFARALQGKPFNSL